MPYMSVKYYKTWMLNSLILKSFSESRLLDKLCTPVQFGPFVSVKRMISALNSYLFTVTFILY